GLASRPERRLLSGRDLPLPLGGRLRRRPQLGARPLAHAGAGRRHRQAHLRRTRQLGGRGSEHRKRGGTDVNRITYALALVVATALVVAGCGSGSDSSSGSAYGGKGGGGQADSVETAESSAKGGYGESAETSGGSGDGIVSAASVGGLGTILVDSAGRTLYDFHKDKGSTSACYGAC